jgi:hypothetical protein
MERQLGFSKEAFSKSGGPLLLSCGSMVNVRFLPLYYSALPRTLVFLAGSGKSVIWSVVSPMLFRSIN